MQYQELTREDQAVLEAQDPDSLLQVIRENADNLAQANLPGTRLKAEIIHYAAKLAGDTA